MKRFTIHTHIMLRTVSTIGSSFNVFSYLTHSVINHKMEHSLEMLAHIDSIAS